ncbi:MAG: endonuclease III [Candidatus Izemoplasmatales bacterium]|nr:endonuclease III [Candidatus Izemoplasmatales bacterium]
MGQKRVERARRVIQELHQMFPDAACELRYQSDVELMVAIILSAQTTDQSVNAATPALFARYRNLEDFAGANPLELQEFIRHLGLFKTKANNIILMAQRVLQEYHGVFPKDHDSLMTLPGVGRKTANVFLAEYYHIPAIAVDTHVHRVSYRLGLSMKTDSPILVEAKLMKLFPQEEWIGMHHKMIHFGRYFCKAKKPSCERCPMQDICTTPFPQ